MRESVRAKQLEEVAGALRNYRAVISVTTERRSVHAQSKKSLPLSSTTMNAGKSTTSIFHTASMPSSAILEHLDLLDAVLREPRRGAADRAEVEAAVLLARRR